MIHFQVFDGPGKALRLCEAKMPSLLQDGEVVVRVLLATICGSDLHTIDGTRREDVPCILGHEAVGEVVAKQGRSEIDVGDRVTWSIASSCGQCLPCSKYALPQKCDYLFKYGHASLSDGTGYNGAYASHVVLRKGTHLVKIPDQMSDALVAPANCALATMIHAISVLKERPEVCVIQGGGLLGIYACGLLHELGVTKIFCLEVRPSRFQTIHDFGGIPVDANKPGAIEYILKEAGREVDAVFEVAGVKEVIPQGVRLLRVGGQYILVGLVHPDSELDMTAETIIRKCISITGVHNYAPPHLDMAISFLDRNRLLLPFADLVSPPYPLIELQRAIQLAREGSFFRVSLKPND